MFIKKLEAVEYHPLVKGLNETAEQISGESIVNTANLDTLISQIFWIAMAVVVALAVYALMRGGFEYMTSSDNAEKKGRAKNRMWAAIGGLVLAVSSYLVLYTINPNITRFNIVFPVLREPELPPNEEIPELTKDLTDFYYKTALLNGYSVDAGTEVQLENTHYYVADARSYPGEKNVAIRDSNGKVIAYESRGFREALRIEGTGRLSDGTIVNVGANNSEYFVTDAQWGLGVSNRKLEPFISVAVNSYQIPIGSILYIKETAGMTLPDGSRHNGFWRADDIGSAIGSGRIDLFVGNKSGSKYLSRHGIKNMQALNAKVVATGQ